MHTDAKFNGYDINRCTYEELELEASLKRCEVRVVQQRKRILAVVKTLLFVPFSFVHGDTYLLLTGLSLPFSFVLGDATLHLTGLKSA